jgi:hypothetical protein
VTERTPGDGADSTPDPLVDEIRRDRRDRRVLVIAAAIGIIAGTVIGMAFVLGAVGHAAGGDRWFHDHDVLLFIVGPPLVSMAIGYAIYALKRRRRRRATA